MVSGGIIADNIGYNRTIPSNCENVITTNIFIFISGDHFIVTRGNARVLC
jgi:hypothetical protein